MFDIGYRTLELYTGQEGGLTGCYYVHYNGHKQRSIFLIIIN